MKHRYICSSTTRISDLLETDFAVRPLPRDRWAMGDYVALEILTRGPGSALELPTGRQIQVMRGDHVVGALGDRYATLEATGSWSEVGDDGLMEVLTGGGVFGKLTSRSSMIQPLHSGRYMGHVYVGDQPARMRSYVRVPADPKPFALPTVVLFGTSMSAGKTTAAGVLIRLLKRADKRVIGAKLTGAGRYRDALTMKDAGADAIVDFVDAGLPSTVCSEELFEAALDDMLAMMGSVEADVAVVEIGASPLEPYNGSMAIERIAPNVRMRILCASDPYAVVGVMKAFGTEPDLVTGIASNTLAGQALSEKLSGVRTLNIRDPESEDEVRGLLAEKLLP